MSKITIQIKNRWTGSILFEYNSENNTVRDTVKEAVKTGADLTRADLSGADLYGADLYGANLTGADLTRAVNSELPIAQTRILPEGDIIGYKKTEKGIVKLLIPSDAKRSHAFGRKCRAEFAKVIEMPEGVKIAYSSHDYSFKYQLGEIVKPKEPFSENWQEECESGIHFFITRIEAENY